MILARLIRVCASALLCAGVSLFPGNASADGAGTVVDGRAILKMSKGSNLCALTFDDGPSSHTERLMEILREQDGLDADVSAATISAVRRELLRLLKQEETT